MKVNAKSLAAAVALALAAGTASAAPIAYDGIFFSAWDTANNNSIVINLNLSVDDFRANPAAAYSLSGNGLTGLQSWLSTANIGAVQWTVMGVNDDGTGANIPPSINYGGVSTSTDIETVEQSWGSFGGLDTTVTTTPTFLNTVNDDLATSDFYTASGIQAFKFAGQDGGVGFEGRSTVGASMEFYSFFAIQDPDQSFFVGDYTELGGSWNLSFAGNQAALAYAPAVPLPAAVWLFGTGLAGLVGVARRRSAVVAA